MLHELNMMVGDIDIFPAIPMFHPPPPKEGNGGGVAFVVSSGGVGQIHSSQQLPSTTQDSRITEIVDEPSQNETTTDPLSINQSMTPLKDQQQEPNVPAIKPITGGGATGFGKRSRRKQE